MVAGYERHTTESSRHEQAFDILDHGAATVKRHPYSRIFHEDIAGRDNLRIAHKFKMYALCYPLPKMRFFSIIRSVVLKWVLSAALEISRNGQ